MSLDAMSWAAKQNCGGPSTKVTLWSIANYAHPKTWCGYPSQSAIAEETEQSVDSVQRRIPELIERGLLFRIPLRYDGRKSVDFFVLRPSPYFGKPLAEIEPLVPRGFTIDPKFAASYVAADCGNGLSEDSKPAAPDVAADCGSTLPQIEPDVTALVRQHEPLREPEEERERAGEPAKEDGLTESAAWSALVKIWPDIALQSESMARAALAGLAPADRKLAVSRVPAFLAYHREKLGKAKLPFLHNYLNERSRWTTLPAAKIEAGTPGERKIVGAFDRAWWFVFFDQVKRWSAALRDSRSTESGQLRRQVSLAQARVGLKLDPARIVEIKEAAKALVQIKVDGDEFRTWATSLRLGGIDLPRPDKAEWIWVPSQWPSDDREREIELQDEAAEIMGVETT